MLTVAIRSIVFPSVIPSVISFCNLSVQVTRKKSTHKVRTFKSNVRCPAIDFLEMSTNFTNNRVSLHPGVRKKITAVVI